MYIFAETSFNTSMINNMIFGVFIFCKKSAKKNKMRWTWSRTNLHMLCEHTFILERRCRYDFWIIWHHVCCCYRKKNRKRAAFAVFFWYPSFDASVNPQMPKWPQCKKKRTVSGHALMLDLIFSCRVCQNAFLSWNNENSLKKPHYNFSSCYTGQKEGRGLLTCTKTYVLGVSMSLCYCLQWILLTTFLNF